MHCAKTERYDAMEYRRCGQSGLLLPELSLGLWQHFSDSDDYNKCKQIVEFAFDSGITHFDLANNYGGGSSERVMGRILNEELSAYRDEIIVSPKAGYDMWPGPYGEWGSRKYLLASLDQSLKRLGLDYVDIFYSHRPDLNTPLEETMGALAHAVKSGKALYVGLSNYPPEMTRSACHILAGMGVKTLIHQPKYSMFDREPEERLLDVLEQMGMGAIAFQPLAQGLLTNRYLNGIPNDSRVAKHIGALKAEQITEQVIDKVSKLNQIAQQRNQSLAQMAIAWLLKDERVTSVLVGASSVGQLADSLGAIKNKQFTQEQIATIENILNTKEQTSPKAEYCAV